MKIADSLIKEKCEQNDLVCPFDIALLGSASYDLTVQDIILDKDGDKTKSYTLKPGESVFISTIQKVKIPNNLIGIIENKTSRIRQGLEVLATPHQPGIETRIFIKVSNSSVDSITLENGDVIAQIYFETIEGIVNQPYNGAFNQEDHYKGLSTYSTLLQVKAFEDKIKQKTENLEKLESKLYGVVAALMAVFVAIMTIIMSSASSSKTGIDPISSMLVANLMIVSSISFLFGVISLFIPNNSMSINKPTIFCFILSLLTFIVCFAMSPELIPTYLK
ncbi:hypothetical protein GNP82_18510 [Aliivibrio fischeri]|uniref:dCTP deaminase n=1 Tax=Aliivibrio fischeri TaxID=668 RepID=UPI0012D9C605|nr:hypothetical protein [Aliivibrio fischeri]MUK39532.1 hypothetical protein [Aliivibrio fischeri]MUL04397.1 hypothetical protein [Aliivibrio fischeri]MUL07568.1 hypothetical protein [Aliivibrio fischeri]